MSVHKSALIPTSQFVMVCVDLWTHKTPQSSKEVLLDGGSKGCMKPSGMMQYSTMKNKVEKGIPFRYGCVVEDSFYCPRPALACTVQVTCRNCAPRRTRNPVSRFSRRGGNRQCRVRAKGRNQALRTQICISVQGRISFCKHVLPRLAAAPRVLVGRG